MPAGERPTPWDAGPGPVAGPLRTRAARPAAPAPSPASREALVVAACLAVRPAALPADIPTPVAPDLRPPDGVAGRVTAAGRGLRARDLPGGTGRPPLGLSVEASGGDFRSGTVPSQAGLVKYRRSIPAKGAAEPAPGPVGRVTRPGQAMSAARPASNCSCHQLPAAYGPRAARDQRYNNCPLSRTAETASGTSARLSTSPYPRRA